MRGLRAFVLAGSVALLGCQAGLSPTRVRLYEEGALYLYLQPLPPGTPRPRIGVEEVSAVHQDGREVSLAVALRELPRDLPGRQRLLAAGPVPAGEYSGFLIRTSRLPDEGAAAQAAPREPEPPVRVELQVRVLRRQAVVVALVVKPGESPDNGASAGPAVSAYLPERPAPGRLAFVANRRSNDLTVFDKTSLQVVAAIATGSGPAGMALDQRIQRLYVALSGEDAVEVADVLGGRVVDRIRLTPGDQPVDLALTPDGRTLLSANPGSNTLSLIDPVSRFELSRIPVASGPRSITVDRTGRRAFVVSSLANTVTVLDLPTRTTVRLIPTAPGPVRGQFNRRGDRLFVIHETVPYVTAINPVTLQVTGRFTVRSGMDAIKVDPGTDLVYLGGQREPVVGVYEPFAFGAVDVLDTGPGVAHMATDADENALYMANPATNRVLVYNRIRKTRLGEIDAGDRPSWISVMGEN